MRFFKNLFNKVEDILTGRKPIDEDLFEELENSLIQADLSVRTVDEIMESLRENARKKRLELSDELKDLLAETISEMMTKDADINLMLPINKPTVYMLVGVNGVGKTTSISKLAWYFTNKGKKVILAAADTFRAAAIEQLEIWANRVNVDIIKHQHGSDPGAVVYDAIISAKSKNADVVIVDTAGRLHTKSNLMEELTKINRSVEKSLGRPADEILLVLDATTGQNAITQAIQFSQSVPITGIILTKMDGTAKGGVVVTIKDELKIPIKLVTSGEGIEQIADFNSKDFAYSIFQDA